jgi:uncharacterized protein (DUF4415 family)
MKRKSSLKTSEEFDEYPAINQSDLNQARFRVNLKDEPRKQRVNIMLDTGVIAYFKAKAGNRGYQTLINEALKKAMDREDLEDTLRKVIRDEIKPAA